jgi:hypothetical protein
MSAPKILYTRLTDYTFSASSTNSNFPLANLLTYFAADVWKPSTLNATQYLNIDFGAARACNCIILDGQNLGGVSNLVGVSLQGADDAGFSVNLVTPTLSASLATSTTPILATFNAVSKRYWRLSFGNTGGSFSPAPQIGNIFLGTTLDFPYGQEFPFRKNQGQFQTSRVRTLSGALRGAQAFAGSGQFEFQFKIVSDAFAALFETFVNTVRGGLFPFYYLDANGTSLYYLLLADDYNPLEQIHADQNDIQSLRMVTQLAALQ